jgi:hypothetical protein
MAMSESPDGCDRPWCVNVPCPPYSVTPTMMPVEQRLGIRQA